MSDRIRTSQDTPWRAVGTGMATPTRVCLGCDKPRIVTGGVGKGARWRCWHCNGSKGRG